ncbi:hypothetical protein [Amycolatopsis sp. DSM 110486]|nr:hypothetical protein [Amycolatopsis sp. DSM 110486]
MQTLAGLCGEPAPSGLALGYGAVAPEKIAAGLAVLKRVFDEG